MFSVGGVLQAYHEYKDNWPGRSNFASASAKGRRYFKIDILMPEFAPQVSLLMHVQTFYPEVESYKKWR